MQIPILVFYLLTTPLAIPKQSPRNLNTSRWGFELSTLFLFHTQQDGNNYNNLTLYILESGTGLRNQYW